MEGGRKGGWRDGGSEEEGLGGNNICSFVEGLLSDKFA